MSGDGEEANILSTYKEPVDCVGSGATFESKLFETPVGSTKLLVGSIVLVFLYPSRYSENNIGSEVSDFNNELIMPRRSVFRSLAARHDSRRERDTHPDGKAGPAGADA